MKFDHEGEAFRGHSHTDRSLSFGMESGKVNKASGNFSYDYAGASGKLSFGDTNKGLSLQGSASIGHVEGGYSADFSSKIPRFSVNAGADTAKFSAEAKINKAGIEHKVASANLKGPGVSASANVGGNTVLPAAKAEAHTLSPSAAVGWDGFSTKLGAGEGPSASAGVSIDNIKPDGISIADGVNNPNGTWSNVNNAISNPGSSFNSPISYGGKSTSFGDRSASLSGVGSVKSDDSGNVSVEDNLGSSTPSDLLNYKDAVTGRGGTEKGSNSELYSSGFNRENLIKDAEKQHEKNASKLNRIDGKDGFFARRNNNSIADKSNGSINKLNNAINEAQSRKQDIDAKLANATPGSREANRLSSQSDKLGKDINGLTGARDKLISDRDRANANLGRVSPNYDNPYRSTGQIVSDARNNSQRFQDTYNAHGMSKQLSNPAVGVCNSQNELNGRIGELDRKLNENNKDIASINKARDAYLNDKGLSLKGALDRGDPNVAKFNEQEGKLRAENQALRAEKGECQKALGETNKNFDPRSYSADFEQKGRDLQAASIDNNNAKMSNADAIANYCNQNGITSAGNDGYVSYLTPDGKPDAGLNALLDEKGKLDNEGNNIQNAINQNNKDLAESEKEGKSSLKVSGNGGNAEVKYSNDDYKSHAQDNKNWRNGKSGDAGQSSVKGENGQENTPSPPGGGTGQQENIPLSSSQSSEGQSQSEQQGQSQEDQVQQAQGNQPSQSSEGQQPQAQGNQTLSQGSEGQQPQAQGNQTPSQGSEGQQPQAQGNQTSSQGSEGQQPQAQGNQTSRQGSEGQSQSGQQSQSQGNQGQQAQGNQPSQSSEGQQRSEERRVGKECRSRWSPYH